MRKLVFLFIYLVGLINLNSCIPLVGEGQPSPPGAPTKPVKPIKPIPSNAAQIFDLAEKLPPDFSSANEDIRLIIKALPTLSNEELKKLALLRPASGSGKPFLMLILAGYIPIELAELTKDFLQKLDNEQAGEQVNNAVHVVNERLQGKSEASMAIRKSIGFKQIVDTFFNYSANITCPDKTNEEGLEVLLDATLFSHIDKTLLCVSDDLARSFGRWVGKTHWFSKQVFKKYYEENATKQENLRDGLLKGLIEEFGEDGADLLVSKAKDFGLDNIDFNTAKFKVILNNNNINDTIAIIKTKIDDINPYENIAAKNRAAVKQQEDKLINIAPINIVGLHNCGNTCYLNAITQALFHTAPLQKLFDAQATTTNDFISKTMFTELTEDLSIFKKLRDGFENYKKASSPISLAEDIVQARTNILGFASGAQEDAQEYLNALLVRLHLELNVRDEQDEIKSIVPNTAQRENLDFKKDELEAKEYSLVSKWFGGWSHVTREIKQYDYSSNRFEFFNMLILDFPADKQGKEFTLKGLLDDYFREQEGSPYAPLNFGKEFTPSVKTSIEEAPEILIIALKRFEKIITGQQITTKKIDNKVEFPASFKLPTNSGNDADYDLYAVSSHGGGTGGGHYWAHIKAGDDWYEANDSTITKETVERVLDQKSQAYLLFYQRKNP